MPTQNRPASSREDLWVDDGPVRSAMCSKACRGQDKEEGRQRQTSAESCPGAATSAAVASNGGEGGGTRAEPSRVETRDPDSQHRDTQYWDRLRQLILRRQLWPVLSSARLPAFYRCQQFGGPPHPASQPSACNAPHYTERTHRVPAPLPAGRSLGPTGSEPARRQIGHAAAYLRSPKCVKIRRWSGSCVIYTLWCCIYGSQTTWVILGLFSVDGNPSEYFHSGILQRCSASWGAEGKHLSYVSGQND